MKNIRMLCLLVLLVLSCSTALAEDLLTLPADLTQILGRNLVPR